MSAKEPFLCIYLTFIYKIIYRRMVSEYGFMSFPSYSTLKPVYSDEDMDWDGKLNDHRQHHGNGNNEIVLEIKYFF